jgi:hypothetical protein
MEKKDQKKQKRKCQKITDFKKKNHPMCGINIDSEETKKKISESLIKVKNFLETRSYRISESKK